jgi:hypothetical protein
MRALPSGVNKGTCDTGTALRGRTLLRMLMLTVLAASTSCSSEQPKHSSTKNAPIPTEATGKTSTMDCLIPALRSAFQTKNPKLSQVGVLDLKAWDFVGPRLILGWAIVEDRVFRGDFNDEMFGVFVVDESLSRVERVVDTFSTRSWFDYEVRFGRFTADSVEVLGRGSTHGDDPTLRVYKWR